MASVRNVLVLAVLCILAGVNSQATDEEVPINADELENIIDEAEVKNSDLTWVECDPSVVPRKSCYDCNTRIICKNIGGLLLECPKNFVPYCNGGKCVSEPSAECA
ncbi:uncharacterized protein LOC111353926 [Spodoptera litura]|uniref:Uncharacterized protein LOC111353926 n=1 Tax=Spodoptera litura TaxID=69820 RepID=A0A9J7E5Z0_SPOLT|nr:uncharacterized protein LOC111353926 [Spodoptera litura]